MSWSDSAEKVDRFDFWMKLAVVFFGLLSIIEPLVFGPLVAIAGGLALWAGHRAEGLRRIPPLIDAFMERESPVRVKITVVSVNLIPFEYRIFVQDEKGRQCTNDFQFTPSTFFPTNKDRAREQTRGVIPAKEMYLEVEFGSLRKALHNLPGQTDKLRKRYRVMPPDGHLKLIDQP